MGGRAYDSDLLICERGGGMGGRAQDSDLLICKRVRVCQCDMCNQGLIGYVGG